MVFLLARNCFVPNPFQFIIYQSYHWCFVFWDTASVIK